MPLPIELVEYIIDATSPHRPTLAVCSLVCKQWLPRSRHHLFASLDLSAHWNPEPNAVTEFMRIVDSPNTTLVPYVTGVVLAKRSWGMTPVQKILTILSRSGIRPGFLYINCPTYEPTHLPIFSFSVAHLTLHLHNDMPMATLIDHVCAFPLLESLYIGGSARYNTDDEWSVPTSQAMPRKLHTLIICDPVFATWALSLDPVPTQISTIVLRHIRLPNHHAEVNRYLASPAAAGIRSLTFQECDACAYIYLSMPSPVPNIKAIADPPPDITRLDALQKLGLETNSSLADCLLSALTALRNSPACETLQAIELYARNEGGVYARNEIELYAPRETDLYARNGQAQWRAADAILSDAAIFPRLRSVAVCARVRTLEQLDFPTDYALPRAVAGQLRRDMARCHGRGLLFVG
ncbi:hypothetical protein C8R44DRAFT_893242 [Mycena epipterygia]|nr:hypothetical protein C8R44DRAFT_893242 [Mycena epipterygia]